MKSTLTLLFGSLAFIAVSAQTPDFQKLYNDYSINFYDVCKIVEKHFDTADKSVKGSGWKTYQRWKYLNEKKYYPSGNRNNVSPNFAWEQYQNFTKINRIITNRNLHGSNWRELGPYTVDSITNHYAAGIGRIECVYASTKDTNIIYHGSRSGGFQRTENGGKTWQGTSSYLPGAGVNTMSVSPWNSDSVLINVQNSSNEYSHGIYRSTDGGKNWVATRFVAANVGRGGLGDNFVIYKIHYHPRIPNLIFVGTNNGLYRSSDNLATFSRVMTGVEITEIGFHPTNDSIVYTYDGYYWGNNKNTLYRSSNFGLSFSLAGTLPGNNDNRSIEFSVSPLCPNCLWVASSTGIWISKDRASNFTKLSTPMFGCGGFAVNNKDTSKMIHGYVDLASSNNGGRSWNQITYWYLGNTNGAGSGYQISYNTSTNYIHADVNDLECIDGRFYACTDGFLCKSTDNGKTWKRIGNGVSTRENYKLGTSQSNHYITYLGSQDNGTSLRNQKGWVEIYGADGMEQIVHPLNEKAFIGTVQYGGRIGSWDGGVNMRFPKPKNTGEAYWEAPFAYDPNNPMTVYDFRDSIYKSDDFGNNYKVVGIPKSFIGNIQFAEIAQNNSNIIAISQGENLDLSTDGGKSFKSIKGTLPSLGIQEMAFDPKQDSTIVVVYGAHSNDGKKVYISKDLGNTWTNITYNLGNMPIRSVVIDHTPQRNIYLGAEIGIFTKPMSSTTWNLYNTNFPNVAVQEMEICWGSNTLKAATWGRGLWEYSLVNRTSFPAILTTNITNPPTLDLPKQGTQQYVTSKIHYSGKLKRVYLRYSVNNSSKLDSIADMVNVADSTWKSSKFLPTKNIGDKTYFKVIAVGANGDSSESYKYMYETKPFEYCKASGSSTDGNLFISEVAIGSAKNTSTNTKYTAYNTPVFKLMQDSIYNISVKANTSWTENDYGAFIDFNKDADFSPNETILLKMNQGSGANNNFKVPKLSNYGDTVKMRLRLSYWNGTPNPCGENQLGEVEDYKVVLKYIPILNYSLSNSIICKNDTVKILYTGDAKADSVKWTLESGSNKIISRKKSDNIFFTAAGNYNLKLEAFFKGDIFTLAKTNILKVNPIYEKTETYKICKGSNYTFPDGSTITSVDKNESYTSKLKTYLNCDSIFNTNLIVTPTFLITNKQKVCSGSNYTFEDGYTENNITTTTLHTSKFSTINGCDSWITTEVSVLQPTFATESIQSCTPIIWKDGKTYSESNTSAKHIIQNAAGCDSTITLNFSYNKVIATILQNGNILTANPAGGLYQWVTCNSWNTLLGETNQNFTPTTNGDYAVFVSKNNCKDTSNCLTINGLNTPSLNSKIPLLLYPNPNKGTFKIELNDPSITTATIQVYSITGKEILYKTVHTKMAKVQLPENYRGQFIIKVMSNENCYVQKVIVE